MPAEWIDRNSLGRGNEPPPAALNQSQLQKWNTFMTHYCYVIVDSDGNSRFIAGDPDLVYGVDWRDNET